ncbi:hypothetical protein TNCV_4814981 [Trichonephila clavipes]|nr:hypothetical protein TNCV_4814981 [Trichonephila clavipes]
MKIGNNGNLVLGPFDESTPCLMIVWLQFLRVGFCEHANQDPSAKSSIKWMDTDPISVLDGGWTHSGLPQCYASTVAIASSVRTVRRLWGCELSIRVNVVRKRSMVNRINCSDGPILSMIKWT